MVHIDLIAQLSSSFELNQDEQFKMSPIDSIHYRNIPADPKLAAVLALIYPKEDQLHMIYIRRISDDPRDKHAGQISFPGGKKEPVDRDHEHTALREANEEVGVDQDKIRVLSKLSPLYIPVSNFLVYGFLGYIDHAPTFIPQLTEVEEIIEVPIAHLLRSDVRKTKDLDVNGRLLKNVPYFDLNGEVLWGATAMMTNEIIYNIKKSIENQ